MIKKIPCNLKQTSFTYIIQPVVCNSLWKYTDVIVLLSFSMKNNSSTEIQFVNF